MGRVIGRLVPRSWPSRLAIGMAALAVALFALLLVLVNAECGTDCAPLAAEYLLEAALIAAVVFGVVFAVVFIPALLVRAMARRLGWHPRRRREGMVLILVAVFVLGVGVERAGLLGRPAAADDFELIEEAWGLLHENYVRASDLDATYMAHAAIWAMTEAVGDTDHTVFLTAEEAADVAEDLGLAASGDDAPLLEWSMIPGQRVALVWIPDFADGVADQLAITLVAIVDAGATGIVLDLRGNTGGLADEAIGVASRFLDGGLVMHRRADGVVEEVPVDGDADDTSTPLVVLVDRDSASSSEVVASALQDAGRATLIGTTTAGTGTILEEFPLRDGSVLWIGTSEWLTPYGRSAWHQGIAPDVVVRLPRAGTAVRPGDLADLGPVGLARSRDAQLLRALEVLEAEAEAEAEADAGAGE